MVSLVKRTKLEEQKQRRPPTPGAHVAIPVGANSGHWPECGRTTVVKPAEFQATLFGLRQ